MNNKQLNKMPPQTFNQKVWELTKKIPRGKVATYKIIGMKLGTRAYRAVGNALRCNPDAPIVPCHRVVASDGSIGGFMGTTDSNSTEIKKKIKMLRKEGIKIKGDKIVEFENVLFRL